jgi:hypothetical protein
MELSVMNKEEREYVAVGKLAEKPQECAGPTSSDTEPGKRAIPCRFEPNARITEAMMWHSADTQAGKKPHMAGPYTGPTWGHAWTDHHRRDRDPDPACLHRCHDLLASALVVLGRGAFPKGRTDPQVLTGSTGYAFHGKEAEPLSAMDAAVETTKITREWPIGPTMGTFEAITKTPQGRQLGAPIDYPNGRGVVLCGGELTVSTGQTSEKRP